MVLKIFIPPEHLQMCEERNNQLIFMYCSDLLMDIIGGFFSKRVFSGTLSLTQENHHFIVKNGTNKCSQWTQIT
jgi:hypothetical protein